MRCILSRLRRDQRGIAAAEFAMILPVLVALAVGIVEYGRLILLTQKLQSGSFILADLTARDRTLSEGQLSNIFLAMNNLIQPYDFSDSGTAIVSSIGNDAGGHAVVKWQRHGAGNLTATSTVGAQGQRATLPGTMTLATGETVIVAEVFFDYQPLIGMTASHSVLHRMAYFRPRLGTLDTLLP